MKHVRLEGGSVGRALLLVSLDINVLLGLESAGASSGDLRYLYILGGLMMIVFTLGVIVPGGGVSFALA